MAKRQAPGLEFDIQYPDEGREDNYLRLEKETAPVVCVLDTKHPRLMDHYWPNTRRMKLRAEELSGLPCLLIHYTQLAVARMDRPNIKALWINHQAEPINDHYTQALYAFIRETRIPAIGFCGGHHHIYLAFGGACEDMRPLRPGEPDTHAEYQPGWLKEWGFLPVQVRKQDPLFAGLGDEITVFLAHVSLCTRVPPGFEVLASTAECPVQALRYTGDRVLYSTQFHPEAWDDEHLDGRVVLQNFFTLAGI